MIDHMRIVNYAFESYNRYMRSSPQEKMVLWDISWEAYERLLTDHLDKSVPRFAYDRGVLEIFRPSLVDEVVNRLIASVVAFVAEGLETDMVALGSSTFKREELQRGFDPDSCFYIQNAERIRGNNEIDVRVDPSPDLVIESRGPDFIPDKRPIYADFGVREVWRHDGDRVTIFALNNGEFAEAPESAVLPPLTSSVLSRFVREGESHGSVARSREVREWARNQARPPG